MSDYLIQDSTLSGIADKIRVLNGTEETLTPTEMQSELDTFNSDISAVIGEQDDLIAQIIGALEGKTVPRTITINVTDNSGGALLLYLDADGNQCKYNKQKSIDSLNGLVFSPYSAPLVASGSYINIKQYSNYNSAFMFLSNGGSITIERAESEGPELKP